ncbi:MAG: LamG-like jellyroll fold domain-containing protein, partial [Myxococcota bacterium]
MIPANTTQENRPILTYSNGQGMRNFALSQALYNYVFRNRSLDGTKNEEGIPQFGDPALSTADADEDLQASLQHAVITFDQSKGRRIFVNGVFTDDEDEVPPAQLFNWDEGLTFSVGAEPTGNRPWRGVVKLIAIYDSVLTQNQITQNFNAGAAQQYILRFGLDSALANGAYIQFTVSEFDAYSYLFCAPLLVTGGQKGFTVQTIRISVNGVPPVASQSFRTLNAEIMADSTQLSNQCQVVPKDLGSAQDVFHVFFDALGNTSSPIADVPASPPPTPGVVNPSPGIGIRDFAEINDSMAELTGVPVTNATVNATYQEILQQLPGNNDVRS